MSDLVDQLKTGRGLTEYPDENGRVMRDAWVHSAMQQAADRIEALEAEVARLREALRRIEAGRIDGFDTPHPRAIAREALTPPAPSPEPGLQI